MDRRSFSKSMVLAAFTPWHYLGDLRRIRGMAGQVPGPFDVRKYGAKGDGTADDGGAFADAIAAAAARGGTVYVPTGTYRTTRTIFLKSGVTLQGAGLRSVITRVNGEALVIAAPNAKHVAVQDLAIAGQFSYGVSFGSSTDATLARCHISGATVPRAGDSGAVLILDCTGVTIEQCRFEGNGGSKVQWGSDIQCDGLGAASREVRILRNECWSSDTAFNIRCFDLSRSEIRGNVVRGAKVRGASNNGYGILIYAAGGNHDLCFENIVADNKVSQTEGCGIYLVRSHRSRVEGNVVDHVASVQSDASLPVGGISLNKSQFCAVVKNTISNSGRTGIVIASAEPGGDHVEVRENVITDCAGYGIQLRGILQDVHVVANRVSRTSGGIGGDSNLAQDDIEITDNILGEITGHPAIRLVNASRGRVKGNTVRDVANYGLDLDFRDDSSVAVGNIVRNAGTSLGKGSDSVRVMRRGRPSP